MFEVRSEKTSMTTPHHDNGLRSGRSAGITVMERLDELAHFSSEPNALTRLYLSPQHKAAALQVQMWMDGAGLSSHIDAVGNVVGRYEGVKPGLPTLLLGSHIDTVRDAGKYDGNLGVVTAIQGVAALNDRDERLPFAIEIIAFGDEEGVRFPVTLTGSRALAGMLDPAALDAEDADGISIRKALQEFGCNPLKIPEVARRKDEVLGYLEVHIEQGPVLEAENIPVGIVTAIAGASRFQIEVKGVAGHAGTVPMHLRHDALTAAAEMVLAIERIGLETSDLVATVGKIEAIPGAVNVIPSAARFTLDIRSATDRVRGASIAKLERELASIAERRGARLSLIKSYDAGAATCAPWLIEQLEAAVSNAGARPLRLVSGAGHDGLAMGALCPIGMLFVRCKGGISHNPAEAITAEDVDVAVRVLIEFLHRFQSPASAKG
jgi:allantoate deiminase